MNETQTNTKNKIIEAASLLFAEKGFDRTSTREIGRRAGVNISSLNYHFKSKQNLIEEVAYYACNEYQQKLHLVAQNPELKSTADFCLEVYTQLLTDGAKCLNEFKLLLDATELPDLGEVPMGFHELNGFLKKELNADVPESDYFWLNSVIYNYLIHTAILSISAVGKQFNAKYLPDVQESNKTYIKNLVESVIRDTNSRYTKH